MKSWALLTGAWLALVSFAAWLTTLPTRLAFTWVDPATEARWQACRAVFDTWLGYAT